MERVIKSIHNFRIIANGKNIDYGQLVKMKITNSSKWSTTYTFAIREKIQSMINEYQERIQELNEMLMDMDKEIEDE